MSHKLQLYLRLAWRNVIRHARRTGTNLFAIALGCAALVIFGGFTHSVTEHQREQVIHAYTGHLQLARRGYWDQGVTRPEAYLLPDYPALARRLAALPHVAVLMPRLSFAGMLSNGESSVVVRGQGLDPNAEHRFSRALTIVSGQDVAADDPEGVVLGQGLAQTLDVKVGDRVTVLTTTLKGATNALDLRVRGIFASGINEYDQRFFRIPLGQSFRLLNTRQVQTVVVGLDDTAHLAEFRAALASLLAADAGLEARAWDELYPVVTNALNWLSAIVFGIRLIILVIVAMSVVNTISQSIRERIGEIGTVAALGSNRRAVMAQFLLEGGILGLLGGALGIVASLLLAYGLLAHGITMPPSPSDTQPELIFIGVLPREVVTALGLSLLTALLACTWPAWRAARLPIVEALRENV